MTYVSSAVSAWEWKKRSWNPGQGRDGFSAAVSPNSLFPSDRKMGYINNLVCQKRVYEAKCNNVCNVIKDLRMKSAIDNQSVSTDTHLSQPERDGKQAAVRRADPTGRVPLSTKVCTQIPMPCLSQTNNSQTNKISLKVILIFFNVFIFCDENSGLSYLLLSASRVCYILPHIHAKT